MSLTLTPDQEAALEQSVRAGRFASSEEALAAAIDHLRDDVPGSPEMRAHLAKVRSMNLYELMQSSPLRGLDIEFPRDRSPMREIDFD